MNRLEFALNSAQALKTKKAGPCAVLFVGVAMWLVFSLFASVASADGIAPGAKHKIGKSGQCYVWAKDC